MVDRRSLLTALTGIGAGAATTTFSIRTRAQQGGSSEAFETIAVLGTGHFGGTIGKRLSAIGYPVIYGSRTPDAERVKTLVRDSGPRASAGAQKDAASRGTIVLFAVPWEPVKGLLPALGDLTGKLLIDPMIAKPKVIEHYPFPADTSTAEQLQSWVPGAHVVKAFPTISFRALADPVRAGGPISVPFAGADRTAKERVARLISELGLDPMDTGPLVAARYIENVLWFEVACNVTNKKAFELYMRHVPT
ncbi:MAG: NADPH-dependent F420 reductase [Steroidobacteraceae bacterium]